MTTVPITGIEAVDRELERRAPFASSDEAEAMAARLMAVWRLLQPGSADSSTMRLQGFRRGRK